MQTINVQINIATPTGRRLLKEIVRHPSVAKVEYPKDVEIEAQQNYTLEEVFSVVEEKMNAHYGTNHKLKY